MIISLAYLATIVPFTNANLFLGTYDVSILFPLKPVEKFDGVYKKKGDGFCLAPGLGETFENKPFGLTSKQFLDFSALILGASANGRCVLTDEELALSRKSDTELMDSHQFLAKLRLLPDAVCSQKSWRIVGFRLDPCVTQKRGQVKTKEDLAQCPKEARLVVQPFTRSGDRWVTLDSGLHLIYSVKNIDEMVSDLKIISKATQKNWQPWLWAGRDNSDPWVLKPHPGLRSEMDLCSGTAWQKDYNFNQRPVSTEIYRFFAKHLTPENLVQIAFFTSNSGLSHWTYGAVEYKDNKFSQLKTVSAGLSPYDSFSNPNISQENPVLPFATHIKNTAKPNLAYWFDPNYQLSFELSAEQKQESQKRIHELNDLMNPHMTSQFDNVHCFACHMTEQVRNDAQFKLEKYFDLGPGAYQKSGAVWRHFPDFTRNTTSLYNPTRSSLNFRNFGYAPGFEIGVSERTLNESDDTVKILDRVYGKN